MINLIVKILGNSDLKLTIHSVQFNLCFFPRMIQQISADNNTTVVEYKLVKEKLKQNWLANKSADKACPIR